MEMVLVMIDLLDCDKKQKYSKKVVASLKEVFGDELCKYISVYIDQLGENNPKKSSFFEKILDDSELYKSIEIAGFSKMSLFLALGSQRKALRMKAIEKIAKIENLNKGMEETILRILKEEDDKEVIEAILTIDILKLQISNDFQEAIFELYLKQTDKKIVQKILQISKKNEILSQKISIFNYLSDGIATTNSSGYESMIVESTLRTINSHTKQFEEPLLLATLKNILKNTQKNSEINFQVLQFLENNAILEGLKLDDNTSDLLY